MGTSFFIPYEDRDLIETYLSKIDFKNAKIINLLYEGSFQVFYEKKLGPFSILMYVYPNYRQVNKVLVNFGMQTFLGYDLASGFFEIEGMKSSLDIISESIMNFFINITFISMK
jgi:hypothetical protein